MSNIKHPKNPNKRGNIQTIALGKDLLDEVKQVAQEENRPANRQFAVIVQEWLETRRANRYNNSQGVS